MKPTNRLIYLPVPRPARGRGCAGRRAGEDAPQAAAGTGRAFAGYSGAAEPRRVAWRHRDVLAAVATLAERGLPERGGEVLCHLPFAHPLARIMGLYAALLGGAALVFGQLTPAGAVSSS